MSGLVASSVDGGFDQASGADLAAYRRLQAQYRVAEARNDLVAVHALVPRIIRSAEAIDWPDEDELQADD